jgi:hypothetical protein
MKLSPQARSTHGIVIDGILDLNIINRERKGGDVIAKMIRLLCKNEQNGNGIQDARA